MPRNIFSKGTLEGEKNYKNICDCIEKHCLIKGIGAIMWA